MIVGPAESQELVRGRKRGEGERRERKQRQEKGQRHEVRKRNAIFLGGEEGREPCTSSKVPKLPRYGVAVWYGGIATRRSNYWQVWFVIGGSTVPGCLQSVRNTSMHEIVHKKKKSR